MKLRNFILGAVTAVMAFAACQPAQENLGTPSITISESAMEFDVAGGEQQLTLNATRDWKVTGVPAWLAVSPEKGEASASDQTVVITALANEGGNRSVDLKFTIGTFSKVLKVTQKGEGGNVLPPAEDGVTPIADVLKLAEGATIESGTIIQGVVISNMELNNLTSKKGMYVQDATGGLQFYLAANHTFAYGTMVKIDISGVKMAAYNGAKQISGLALDKITTVSTGNTVDAKVVTMADFLANKYEGQYVALEGVQVKAADLSKTWVVSDSHTSIGIEDANGNSFVVFSSKYASYKAQTVAQGSGTIKGISSINNGNMQIIFTQESDFAGLTGARFDGEVAPPTGGDNTGGDDNTGGQTPPAGDGPYEPGVTWTLGSKAYDNTTNDYATNVQTAVVNGVQVANVLKLGTASVVGDATVNIPTGTKKLGFYCVAWKGKSNSPIKFSANGTEITTITPKANDGATGNPPYTLALTDADYYTVDVPAGATAVKVETTVASQARVLFIGLKALTE